jgi:hypothetical protein
MKRRELNNITINDINLEFDNNFEITETKNNKTKTSQKRFNSS